MCLAGTEIASLSLTQEMAGWQGVPFYYNHKYFSLNSVNSVKIFREGKTQMTEYGINTSHMLWSTCAYVYI